MASVQGFVFIFQAALLVLALAARLGIAVPDGVHEAAPLPPPAASATHALL